MLGFTAVVLVLLAEAIDRFRCLKVGLGFVLTFVGIKMLIRDHYQMPIGVSLGVICVLLGASIAASLLAPPESPPMPVRPHGDGSHGRGGDSRPDR